MKISVPVKYAIYISVSVLVCDLQFTEMRNLSDKKSSWPIVFEKIATGAPERKQQYIAIFCRPHTRQATKFLCFNIYVSSKIVGTQCLTNLKLIMNISEH